MLSIYKCNSSMIRIWVLICLEGHRACMESIRKTSLNVLSRTLDLACFCLWPDISWSSVSSSPLTTLLSRVHSLFILALTTVICYFGNSYKAAAFGDCSRDLPSKSCDQPQRCGLPPLGDLCGLWKINSFSRSPKNPRKKARAGALVSIRLFLPIST